MEPWLAAERGLLPNKPLSKLYLPLFLKVLLVELLVYSFLIAPFSCAGIFLLQGVALTTEYWVVHFCTASIFQLS